jgi:hypothetical protein
MRRIGKMFDIPQICNPLMGGHTPILSMEELGELGFNCAVLGLDTVMHAAKAIENVLLDMKSGRFAMRNDGMNFEEYKKVVGYIKSLEAKSPVWHAVLYNCNAYVGDIAKFMGMEVPSSTMLMPAAYINELKQLNINKKGLIGTPKNVASAEQLRSEALRSLGRRGNRAAPTTPEAAPIATENAPAATARPKPARGAAAKPQDTKQQTQASSRQVESANNHSPN